jgi:hypothetical protein
VVKRLALVVLLLAGCAPPEGSGDAPTPKPFYSKAPSSATPTPAPIPETAQTAVVRGTVLDTNGKPVPDDVTLRFKALRPPFERVIPLKGGVYAAPGVPLRADLTITVERFGKVVLKLYRSVGPTETDVVFNIGGGASADPAASGVPL